MPTKLAKQPGDTPGKRFGLVVVPTDSLQKEPPPKHGCGCCGGMRWWTQATRTDWVCLHCHLPPQLAIPGEWPPRGYRQHVTMVPHPATYPPVPWLLTPTVPYKPRQRGATEDYGPC